MLNQEITFDMGHMILLLALVVFVFFVSSKCKLSCNGSENLDVAPVHYKSCRCPGCAQTALQRARDGDMYGCDPNNPFVPFSGDECVNQYHKTMLHGCGIA